MSDVLRSYKINDNLVDLRNYINHPIALRYAEIYKEILINAPADKGRISPFFKLNYNAPFYIAAKAGVNHLENCTQVVKDELDNFYYEFQPSNVNEWFQLNSTSNALAQLPPWAGILPWRARTIENYQETIKKGTLSDNQKADYNADIYKGGWAYCGPVKEEKCMIETKRIVELIESINKHGYIRNNDKDGDIVATALICDDNSWVWVVTNGYHRAAVLAAMGFAVIPIRINLVIRRNEVHFWPQVSNGLYTKEQALQIFDNLTKH